jgi:hypothetical protein
MMCCKKVRRKENDDITTFEFIITTITRQPLNIQSVTARAGRGEIIFVILH